MPLDGSAMPPSSCFRPSRLIARFAALRTRTSANGVPSSLTKSYVHACGYEFVTIWKPAWRMLAIASGAGASIQSTWPERSAAVRADASGTGITTSRSSLGTRLGSQYAVLGTISRRSRGANFAAFHGPVPDGSAATFSQLLPSRS